MNILFGLELPTSVNFIIAFVVVLALIAAVAWAIRRFGATRLDAAARARQPRLAVIDSASVDSRRKLVIVRRDNVEHVLLLGMSGETIVERSIKLPEISTDPIPGTTFLTIRPEPRI